MTTTNVSRWRCPACGSPNVEVELPAWFRESPDYVLTHVGERDREPRSWHCSDCYVHGAGRPVAVAS